MVISVVMSEKRKVTENNAVYLSPGYFNPTFVCSNEITTNCQDGLIKFSAATVKVRKGLQGYFQ